MDFPIIRERIKCKDGISLSVQASRYHYCTPRDNTGPYTHVEVGFILDENENQVIPPESWRNYSDGEFPNSVYGYVPLTLVVEFIIDHGGVDGWDGTNATALLPAPIKPTLDN